MAGAGAVSEGADGGIFMLARLVISRMAGRAIRLVGRIGPGHDFGIGLVAIVTAQAGAMVARVSGAAMSKRESGPVVGVVADVALLIGHEMAHRFSGSSTAVMTA